jgi:hypothetical protein
LYTSFLSLIHATCPAHIMLLDYIFLLSAVLQIGRSLVRSQLVLLEIYIDVKSFRSHYGPGVDAFSNRNEYQEHFRGVKAAGTYGWQPHNHSVPLSRILGAVTLWNPLGHSRSVTRQLYLCTVEANSL